MDNNQSTFPTCRHCGARLHASAKSTTCKACRYKGHKEFGNCDKCAEKKA